MNNGIKFAKHFKPMSAAATGRTLTCALDLCLCAHLPVSILFFFIAHANISHPCSLCLFFSVSFQRHFRQSFLTKQIDRQTDWFAKFNRVPVCVRFKMAKIKPNKLDFFVVIFSKNLWSFDKSLHCVDLLYLFPSLPTENNKKKRDKMEFPHNLRNNREFIKLASIYFAVQFTNWMLFFNFFSANV